MKKTLALIASHRRGCDCLLVAAPITLEGLDHLTFGLAHRLIRFRQFIGGSLALASLNLACRNPVPTFPQRSPPSLLTTAACGGLRSTPDCRPRRTSLHLSYSYAPPCGPAILVTQDPLRSSLWLSNCAATNGRMLTQSPRRRGRAPS